MSSTGEILGDKVVNRISGDETSVQVQFAPVHVRPHTPHQLPDVFLVLPPAFAGTDIPIRWRATASNTPGQMSGLVTVSVG